MVTQNIDKTLLLILAAWRISCLFVYEDGPFDVFQRIRDAVGIHYDEFGSIVADGFLASLFSCMYCLSIWVGLFIVLLFVFMGDWLFYFLIPLSISGGVLLLDRIGNK